MINVPSLRARREDIPDLARDFPANHRFSSRVDKVFSTEAMQRLLAYDFPGNIRELRNIVERAAIVSGAERELRARHLALGSGQPGSRSAITLSFDHEPTLEEMQQRYLGLMLKRYSGHRGKAAPVLDVSERSDCRMLSKRGE